MTAGEKGVKDKTIAVWFSCGAASAIAARETLRIYGKTNTVRVVNNPVLEEDSDNVRFLHDVEEWLGVPIESAVNPAYPGNSADDVWRKRRYMSGVAGAPCTLELKKRARQLWENRNPCDYHVLGFTADEKKRHERFIQTERANVLPVLIEQGISKLECMRRIAEAGIALPRIYKLGFPNANCVGCVKATSPTYWNAIREHYPDVFSARAALSDELGVKLVRHKGKRIPLSSLPADAQGAPLTDFIGECGIFCEEKI